MTEFDLRLEDCVAGMAKLPDEHVDLVVTSPPYNLGIRYGKFSDRQDRQSYLRWCGEWATQIRRVLKSTGSFFLNIGAAPSNPMLPHEIVFTLRELFVLQNTIHWIKSIAIENARERTSRRIPHLNPLPQGEEDAAAPGEGKGVGLGEEDQPSPSYGSASAKRQARARVSATTYGHFKPISSPRFLNDCHEYIFHFTITGKIGIDRLALGVPYQDKSNISRWSHTGGSDRRCRGNTWFIPYETIQRREKERPHPATFPVALAENCIKLHGPAGAGGVETMLDPFVGIGNSAVAAKKCGVKRFIGFEIDENYLAEAKQRIG